MARLWRRLRSRPGAAEPLRISIIMPTYLRAHTIHRTIATIQAQSYPHWELIVVNNGPRARYRFADRRIRVCRHARRTSASYARNQGLRHATGDLVCFFDDDDDMFPGYLESFAAAFRRFPAAKMVRCGMIIWDGSVDYSYATPECCLRRAYARPRWLPESEHDQQYFGAIVSDLRWTEAAGDIVVLRQALCRANNDPQGGRRSGHL